MTPPPAARRREGGDAPESHERKREATTDERTSESTPSPASVKSRTRRMRLRRPDYRTHHGRASPPRTSAIVLSLIAILILLDDRLGGQCHYGVTMDVLQLASSTEILPVQPVEASSSTPRSS